MSLTAKEIAPRIDAHLKRFESDPKINVAQSYQSNRTGKMEQGIHPYYYAGARATGRWVSVVYITFQGNTNLTRDEASHYLDWLDAGNVGTHFEAER